MQRVSSPLRGWLGGKYRLAKKIVELIPENHNCYVEPFAGAAWVLFHKDPSKSEVLNDYNLEIITLYRVLQNHLEEFIRHFKWVLYHREEFERQKALPPDKLTDIQRAVRFYYIQRNCFGGRINNPAFGTSTLRPPKLNLLRIEEDLSIAHLRLAKVYLESKPYGELIRQYDRPYNFFYLDPPYWGCEDYYGKQMFSRDDFATLAELLAGIKGRFLLSLNDVPQIREIFKAFKIDAVSLRYSVGRNDSPGKELFIRNY